MSDSGAGGLVITPPQLVLAIAEHEELAATCAALPGMTRERAQRLLRGIALALQRPPEHGVERGGARRETPADARGETRGNPPAAARSAAASPPKTRDSSSIAARDSSSISPSPSPAGSLARAIVYSDGASRGNPGPAGAGAIVADEQGRVVQRLGKYLGRETNNIAEYWGLLIGLRGAQALGAKEVEVRADSELMIKQLKGEYRVKNEGLKPLFAEAKALLASFSKVKLKHVFREENTLADEMSNRAIDEKM